MYTGSKPKYDERNEIKVEHQADEMKVNWIFTYLAPHYFFFVFFFKSAVTTTLHAHSCCLR